MTERLRHLCKYTDPARRGFRKYRVRLDRPESAPLPSMIPEGVIYRRPAERAECIVYAAGVDGPDSVEQMLAYHYGLMGRDFEYEVLEDLGRV